MNFGPDIPGSFDSTNNLGIMNLISSPNPGPISSPNPGPNIQAFQMNSLQKI